MTSMTVDAAKNIGIAVALGLVVVMVLMAWLIKNVTVKLISVLIVAGLAFGVWTQRSLAAGLRQQGQGSCRLGEHERRHVQFMGSDIDVSVP